MLPVFTTTQVKDGVDTGDLLIDLSDYMKKKDGATKAELDSLTAVVANKLDATPQHKHDISNVKDLQEALDGKYDTSKKYAHNTILSDVDKIAYIEAPKVQHLEVAMNSTVEGYNFYVDDASGDLMILSPSSVLVATYSLASNSWTFGGVSLKDIANNESVNTEISNLKAVDVNTATILENHTDALNAVCNATLVNINDINTIANTVNEHDGLIRANSVDITAESARITAVQDALNNHTHTSFNNNVLINGWLTVDNSTTIKGAVTVDKWLTTKSGVDLGGNTTIAGDLSVKGTNILSKITELENILKNHYDALLILCQKHGMVDSNTSDGSNVTPK